jgi:hypothetical protein
MAWPGSAFTGPQNANTAFTFIVPLYAKSWLDGITSRVSL